MVKELLMALPTFCSCIPEQMDFSSTIPSNQSSSDENVNESQPTNLIPSKDDDDGDDVIPLSQCDRKRPRCRIANPNRQLFPDVGSFNPKIASIPPPPPPPPTCTPFIPSNDSSLSKSCVKLDTNSLTAGKKSLKHVQWAENDQESDIGCFIGPVNQNDEGANDNHGDGFIGPLFPDPTGAMDSESAMIGPCLPNQSTSMDLVPVTFVAQGILQIEITHYLITRVLVLTIFVTIFSNFYSSVHESYFFNI